jgi:hypothetical protein
MRSAASHEAGWHHSPRYQRTSWDLDQRQSAWRSSRASSTPVPDFFRYPNRACRNRASCGTRFGWNVMAPFTDFPGSERHRGWSGFCLGPRGRRC